MRTLIAILLAAAVTPTYELSFSLRGDRARGWPEKVKVTLSAGATVVEKTIEAVDARRAVTFNVAPGAYRLTIAAAGHRKFERQVEIIDQNLSLREIALAPIPAVSGRVIERMKDVELPLAGAQVMAGSRQIAVTDEHGMFRAELRDDVLPEEIVVTHIGQGSKTIPLGSNLAAENDLGTIELPRGVTVKIALERPYGEPKPLVVSLVEKGVVGTRELKPKETEATFNHIAPGTYQIVVKGTEPLERMTDKVDVATDDVETRVRIEPFELEGRVILGGEPMRGDATIDIGGAVVPIDKDGRFGGSMWQHGKVTGWLKTPLSANAIKETSPELGPGPTEWIIDLKRRFIIGHVFDAETKEPVTRAAIELQITSGDKTFESTVAVQKDGSYSIFAVQNGRYDVRVTSADHAEARRTILVREETEGRIVDFPLEGGVEAVVYCSWANGQPVAGAAVMSLFSSDDRMYKTDAAGRLALRLHAGEARSLGIVPREGSFAFVDVKTPRSGSAPPMQVMVPPPAGSLRISIVGKPPRRPFLITFNGHVLPPPMLQRMHFERIAEGVVRFSALPAGMYEVALMGPPARAAVTMGEEAVELSGGR